MNDNYVHFLNHEPCPQCKSRDNLGRYSDGHAYCFGCNYWEPPDNQRSIAQKLKSVNQPVSIPAFNIPSFPDDARQQIGAAGWTWLNKYGILPKEVETCWWSDTKQWLIFPVYSIAKPDLMIAWQARNLNKNRPKPKYWTYGHTGRCLDIRGIPSNMIILVEDVLSAIKVGRHTSTQPMYGSHIPLETLTVLSKRFKQLGIWLDIDKAKEGLKTRLRASQLGFESVFTIYTEKDPKECTDTFIQSAIYAERN